MKHFPFAYLLLTFLDTPFSQLSETSEYDVNEKRHRLTLKTSPFTGLAFLFSDGVAESLGLTTPESVVNFSEMDSIEMHERFSKCYTVVLDGETIEGSVNFQIWVLTAEEYAKVAPVTVNDQIPA